MSDATIFPDMDPDEEFPVTFAYADELHAGETVTVPVVSVVLLDGVDATPGDLYQGSPQVDGANVLQWVKNPVSGCNYGLKCKAPTSEGRVLVRAAILPGRSAI